MDQSTMNLVPVSGANAAKLAFDPWFQREVERAEFLNNPLTSQLSLGISSPSVQMFPPVDRYASDFSGSKESYGSVAKNDAVVPFWKGRYSSFLTPREAMWGQRDVVPISLFDFSIGGVKIGFFAGMADSMGTFISNANPRNPDSAEFKNFDYGCNLFGYAGIVIPFD